MASKNELMEGKSAMAADVELEPLTSNTQALRRVEPSITEAKNNPVDPARQHLVYHLRLWYFELGAAVFSLLCILAVTIVLHDLDGTLLDAWSLSISPNALVSFIATLAKSSLLLVLAEVISQLKWMHFTSNESRQLSDMELFNKAARGPLGSLRLLTAGHSKRLMPYLAAAIVLVALLVDLFVQLILSFPSRGSLSRDGSAQVPSAMMFQSTVFQDLSTFTGDADNLFSAMSSAAFISATGVESSMMTTCSTSNCTWEPWTSLGVCGSCHDVTASTKTVCSGRGNLEEYFTCTSTLPSGRTVQSFTYLDVDTQFFTWFNTTRNSTLNAYIGNGRNAITDTWRVGQAPVIVLFSAVKVDKWLNGSQDALFADCDLSFCSKHYSGSYVQNCKIFHATPMEQPLSIMTAGIEAHDYACDHATGDYGCDPGSPYVLELAQPPQPSDQKQFTIDLNGAQYWMDFMADLFDLRWYYNDGTNESNNYYEEYQHSRHLGWEAQPPDISQPLAVADDLDAKIRLMASAFTNVLQNQTSNGTMFSGSAFENRTFIAISWGWLALPIVLVLASLVLLLVVIVQNRNMGLDVWKSDGVPLLFHGLEGWDSSDHNFDSIRELEKKTEQMWGTLVGGQEGRAFVRRTNGQGNAAR